MCGIAGILGGGSELQRGSAVGAMTGSIRHRGPDADGLWADDANRVALGHRRLAILDLTPDGAQPMQSSSGRYVVVFNGEVYNFAQLREELAGAGHRFRGRSDTEVVLAAFERWGVDASVPKLAGMFAIAVWDRELGELTLVRDRLGEKPLYYGRVAGAWVFASELKAVRRVPGWTPEISPAAVAQLLQHGYVRGPLSIYETVYKVRPGAMVVLRADGASAEREYWSAYEAAMAGLADPLRGDADAIADVLDATLRPIVRDEMVADVPLGAFLSGGIDSSLVVALMQTQSSRPVRTFTIGVDDERLDEARFAAAVAAHLGTDHTELNVRGEDALQFVDDLPMLYDEPMADPSQLPTLLVSRLTRQHVTVALSGDGGDELFGGYRHHRAVGTTESISARTPRGVGRLLGPALLRMPEPPPAVVARMLTGGGNRLHGERPANTITRLGALLVARDPQSKHYMSLAMAIDPARLLAAPLRSRVLHGESNGPWLSAEDPYSGRMLADAMTYLPDDILVKVDRAAMAFSLETRAPLLDHRVFELAWRIPYREKVKDGVGKIPLRNLLYRYVPRALVDRPKRGFSIPLAEWLRGPLQEWAADLLAPQVLSATGVLATAPVRRLWTQHQERVANHAEQLWAILTLVTFLRSQSAATPCHDRVA